MVTMKLYLTRDRMQFPTTLVLEEGSGLYEWSAASGLFVRAPWLEEDFDSLRPSLTYEEIDERRALALVQARRLTAAAARRMPRTGTTRSTSSVTRCLAS
jgi:hypothetical protein